MGTQSDRRGNYLAHAQRMVTALEQAAADNIGVRSVTVDGNTTTYDTAETHARALDHWRKKVAQYSGSRRRIETMNLGNAW